MGAGKSAASTCVRARFGTVQVSFATPLKQLLDAALAADGSAMAWLVVTGLFQPPHQDRADNAYKTWEAAGDLVRGEDWSKRQFCQALGMCYRDRWDDVWVESMVSRGAVAEPGVWAVVDDLRFHNEARALRDRGFALVRCVCPDEIRLGRLQARDGALPPKSELTHCSETALDDWAWDYTLDTSGTVEELRARVIVMVGELMA